MTRGTSEPRNALPRGANAATEQMALPLPIDRQELRARTERAVTVYVRRNGRWRSR